MKVDRNTTHHPSCGLNSKPKCQRCRSGRRGCHFVLGSETCDNCTRRSLPCIVDTAGLQAHARVHKRTGGSNSQQYPQGPNSSNAANSSMDNFNGPRSSIFVNDDSISIEDDLSLILPLAEAESAYPMMVNNQADGNQLDVMKKFNVSKEPKTIHRQNEQFSHKDSHQPALQPRPTINRTRHPAEFFNAANTLSHLETYTENLPVETSRKGNVESEWFNGPLQSILCCGKVKLQPYTQNPFITSEEHAYLSTVVSHLAKEESPENASFGAASVPGQSFWLEYSYLFATLSTDTKGNRLFRLFGVKRDIEKYGLGGEFDEIFVENRPEMVARGAFDGTKEVFVRTYSVDYKCPVHTDFVERHAYCVEYEPSAPLLAR